MHPDDALPPGQVFFAPPGTPLPTAGDLENFTPLGYLAEGFGVGMDGDGAEPFWRVGEALKSLTLVAALSARSSAMLTKAFFGPRLSKRQRRVYDSQIIRARKIERDQYRRAQRARIGIKEEA